MLGFKESVAVEYILSYIVSSSGVEEAQIFVFQSRWQFRRKLASIFGWGAEQEQTMFRERHQ